MWRGQKQGYVRRWVAQDLGKPIGPKVRYSSICENPLCVAPHHLKQLSLKAFLTMAAKRKSPAVRVKERAKQSARRQAKALLKPEDVAYIRENPDGMTNKALGKKFGCSATLVWDVQHYRSYKDHNVAVNPFTHMITWAGR